MALNRRRFLRTAALGAAAVAIPLARSARAYAANNSVRVAVIGAGGRGA
ncbi:MAG: twin-arginine translocation signal domain-containing protein, partial [Planctomycetia bacterium]|nr:twin-arginine translocation signal domain-containing protein [Planctomycetia bacterium]